MAFDLHSSGKPVVGRYTEVARNSDRRIPGNKEDYLPSKERLKEILEREHRYWERLKAIGSHLIGGGRG